MALSSILRWAVVFFILALVTAFFGFGGIVSGATGIAKILFFGFVFAAVVALVAGVTSRSPSA